MSPCRKAAPDFIQQPTVLGNVGIPPKCLCYYENEIQRLTEENERLKLSLSEKLNALLSSKY